MYKSAKCRAELHSLELLWQASGCCYLDPLVPVQLWYKQGILYKGACGALAALVSRQEGAPVGASGVAKECGQDAVPEHIASDDFGGVHASSNRKYLSISAVDGRAH
jgi:hypothetical protein